MRHREGSPLLEACDLVKKFPLRGRQKVLTAVNHVSFTLWPGETLALVGESGSGKTTVGRCILRVLSVSSGQIWFDGHDITHLSQRDLRHLRPGLQAVFQDPLDSLDPKMRVEDIVEEPLLEHTNLPRKERSGKVIELLDRVGLDPQYAVRYPAQLTAGQQQRVAIARAIATSPKLVVLDEPTSTLDPIARAEIMQLIVALQSGTGMSLLFISHDLVSVRHVAHRVAVMYLGEIVEQGPVELVFERPSHPYTRALLALVPSVERGLIGTRGGVELSGEIPSPIDLPQGCYLASRCPFVLPGCSAQHPNLQPVGMDQLSRCLRETGELPSLSADTALFAGNA
jgi:oligopeptide/dipeptide ABC transporter ATP-binding protein